MKGRVAPIFHVSYFVGEVFEEFDLTELEFRTVMGMQPDSEWFTDRALDEEGVFIAAPVFAIGERAYSFEFFVWRDEGEPETGVGFDPDELRRDAH